MECRYVHDPLEQRACNASYDFLAGICSVPGVARVLRDLAAGDITKEEADNLLKEIYRKKEVGK